MSQAKWVKTPCDTNACVEVGRLPYGDFAIRNSELPDVKAYFSRAEIVAFIHAAKVGAFDHLVGLD